MHLTLRRGMPIQAPPEVARELGFPEQQEDVGTSEEIKAAALDPCQ